VEPEPSFGTSESVPNQVIVVSVSLPCIFPGLLATCRVDRHSRTDGARPEAEL